MREVGGRDAAAAIAETDRHTRGGAGKVEMFVLVRGFASVASRTGAPPLPPSITRYASLGRSGGTLCDRDLYWLPLPPRLYRGAECILQEFRKDVFEMGRDVSEGRVRSAVDHERRTDAVFQLAELGHEGFAVADDGCGVERGVDDANMG